MNFLLIGEATLEQRVRSLEDERLYRQAFAAGQSVGSGAGYFKGYEAGYDSGHSAAYIGLAIGASVALLVWVFILK